MKRLTKSTLANTLQIGAILIMFGYPGSSPDKAPIETTSAFNIPPAIDTTVRLNTGLFKSVEGYTISILLKQ
jgi:hypothetical protein